MKKYLEELKDYDLTNVQFTDFVFFYYNYKDKKIVDNSGNFVKTVSIPTLFINSIDEFMKFNKEKTIIFKTTNDSIYCVDDNKQYIRVFVDELSDERKKLIDREKKLKKIINQQNLVSKINAAANIIQKASTKGSANYIIGSNLFAKMWDEFILEEKIRKRRKKLERLLKE